MKQIVYMTGIKYWLAEDYTNYVGIVPPVEIQTEYICLWLTGILTIRRGYPWDGPTGAIDTDDFMRSSLEHDALYECMRKGWLPLSFRGQVDDRLQACCREDGMPDFRVAYVGLIVDAVGEQFAKPENMKPYLRAPVEEKPTEDDVQW